MAKQNQRELPAGAGPIGRVAAVVAMCSSVEYFESRQSNLPQLSQPASPVWRLSGFGWRAQRTEAGRPSADPAQSQGRPRRRRFRAIRLRFLLARP